MSTSPASILLRGFDTPHTLPVLRKLLERLQPRLCTHIVDPRHYPDRAAGQTPEVQELNILELIDGSWPAEAAGGEAFSGREIVELAPLEAEVLRMMDRMDQKILSTYGSRKSYFLEVARQCRALVRARGFDLALFHTVPHHPVDYLLYHFCRVAGARTLFMERLPFQGTLLLVDDWRTNGREFSGWAAASESDLGQEFESHFKMQTEQAAPKYFHVEHFYRSRAIENRAANRIKKLCAKASRGARLFIQGPGSLLEKAHSKHQFRARTAELRRYYAEHSSPPNLTEKFIYFPLHMQPEATTSPQGGVFVDQELAIRLVHDALPEGWLLYVKEHAAQDAEGRTRRFYEILRTLPKVRFVPASVSSIELIRACQAVATITGTAGWEALFRNRPVLLFGHPYYQYAPGIFRVQSVEEIRAALATPKPEDAVHFARLRAYLGEIQRRCSRGFVEPRYAEVVGLSPEENSRLLSEAVVARIRPTSSPRAPSQDRDRQERV